MWDLLRSISITLDEQKISHMIVGSFAASLHGFSRATHDIDLVIAVNADELSSLLKALGDGYYYDHQTAFDALTRHEMFNIIDKSSMDKIDFWICGNDDFSQSQFSRRDHVDAGGYMVWVQSAEDTILSKLLWHVISKSERQLEDVKSILIANQDELDWDYLNQWAESLKISELLNKQKEDI